jgi:Outer membrane protein beta-barrel domain
MKKILFAAALAAASANAVAGDVYGGAGLSLNSASGYDDATGYQFFLGYDLKGVKIGNGSMSLEVGYMDSGDFDYEECFPGFCVSGSDSADGLWGTGVIFLPIAKQLDFIGRLGLDIGDDDGIMFGVGVGYAIDKKIQLRGEYVIREDIDSLQANLAFRF